MDRENELQDELIDALNTNTRISNRFVFIGNKILETNKKIGELHNMVYNLLVFMGYDLQAQDFLESHNEAFTSFSNNMGEMADTIDELRGNLKRFREIYKEIDDLRLEQLGFWRIEK